MRDSHQMFLLQINLLSYCKFHSLRNVLFNFWDSCNPMHISYINKADPKNKPRAGIRMPEYSSGLHGRGKFPGAVCSVTHQAQRIRPSLSPPVNPSGFHRRGRKISVGVSRGRRCVQEAWTPAWRWSGGGTMVAPPDGIQCPHWQRVPGDVGVSSEGGEAVFWVPGPGAGGSNCSWCRCCCRTWGGVKPQAGCHGAEGGAEGGGDKGGTVEVSWPAIAFPQLDMLSTAWKLGLPGPTLGLTTIVFREVMAMHLPSLACKEVVGQRVGTQDGVAGPFGDEIICCN